MSTSATVEAPSAPPPPDPFTMTATSYQSGYSPAYIGNGYVGTRVPAQGMGYVADATVPTTTVVAGVWQQTPSQDVVSAAPLPGWDELRFTDGGSDYSLASGTVAGWQQRVDMRTGVISTELDWTSPAGHTTHLARASADAATASTSTRPCPTSGPPTGSPCNGSPTRAGPSPSPSAPRQPP